MVKLPRRDWRSCGRFNVANLRASAAHAEDPRSVGGAVLGLDCRCESNDVSKGIEKASLPVPRHDWRTANWRTLQCDQPPGVRSESGGSPKRWGCGSGLGLLV